MDVVVLEREHMCGYHSTGRAAGLFSENYGSEGVQILSMLSRPFFERVPDDCRREDQSTLLSGWSFPFHSIPSDSKKNNNDFTNTVDC